ncbi:MAG: hypothetical protein R3F56_04550 [Planctomycetota bacterium]
MAYRCEAGSVAGFVQQLACCYVRHGYHYYVVGEIPAHKDAGRIDAQLVERYELDVSRFLRARRKRAGLANAQYLRYRGFFVLCATGPRGEHRFFDEHSSQQIRNIRETPIGFAGYSIGYHRGADRRWHASVRIHPERYRDLKAHFLDIAKRRSAAELAAALRAVPFEPYAPIRRQLLAILRAVNRDRKVAGLPQLETPCFDFRRRIVRPFGDRDRPVDLAQEAA